jgi:UDP-galactopyranose mutase
MKTPRLSQTKTAAKVKSIKEGARKKEVGTSDSYQIEEEQRAANPVVPNEARRKELPDLVCLSHLRWDFVYQRPQHLLSRCAKEGRRVFFVEEPVFDDGPIRLKVSRRDSGVLVVVPHLPVGFREEKRDVAQKELLDHLFAVYDIQNFILWYYTPMAWGFTQHLKPLAIVYDCMDELSAFKAAPPALRFRETELFRHADLVFTGGQSLYEAKRRQHPHHPQIRAFPSSIDASHFSQARRRIGDPPDQSEIPRPRLGFFGVIDERLDIELLDGLAAARPDWHFVMIGPVVKIDPAELPRRPNIHYLGSKAYEDLPAYLAGWDVALLLFARNEATRFISPTKTPEYLAAGRPVVSTSIRDVVRPYEELGLVRIADTVEGQVSAIEASMVEDSAERLRRVDAFLAQTSWDLTWAHMSGLITRAVLARQTRQEQTRSPMAAGASSSNDLAAAG